MFVITPIQFHEKFLINFSLKIARCYHHIPDPGICKCRILIEFSDPYSLGLPKAKAPYEILIYFFRWHVVTNQTFDGSHAW